MEVGKKRLVCQSQNSVEFKPIKHYSYYICPKVDYFTHPHVYIEKSVQCGILANDVGVQCDYSNTAESLSIKDDFCGSQTQIGHSNLYFEDKEKSQSKYDFLEWEKPVIPKSGARFMSESYKTQEIRSLPNNNSTLMEENCVKIPGIDDNAVESINSPRMLTDAFEYLGNDDDELWEYSQDCKYNTIEDAEQTVDFDVSQIICNTSIVDYKPSFKINQSKILHDANQTVSPNIQSSNSAPNCISNNVELSEKIDDPTQNEQIIYEESGKVSSFNYSQDLSFCADTHRALLDKPLIKASQSNIEVISFVEDENSGIYIARSNVLVGIK
jgi:hypothetical protein